MSGDVSSEILDLLSRLVRCESVNPAFRLATGGSGSGEAVIATLVVELFHERGLEVTTHEAGAGRTSVVGVRRGSGGGRSLMLNGHLDTVGTDEMEAPFEARIEGGRLYGRGALDMKGGLAAALAAVSLLDDDDESGASLAGDLVLAFVADEEDASLGTAQIAPLHAVDGAVVLEPTQLRLCVAHRGFTWVRVTTEGFACHGSDFARGEDANLRMGAVLGELAGLEAALRRRTPHPLVGPPSLHAPLLEGGVGPSVYSPRCTLLVERRTVPGETPAAVVAEIEEAARAASSAGGFPMPKVEEVLSRPAFEGRPMYQVKEGEDAGRGGGEDPVGGTLAEALQAAARSSCGDELDVAGVPFWTDGALLAETGTDVVIFGPAGAGLHQVEEWVELDSVETCARILAATARRYCG